MSGRIKIVGLGSSDENHISLGVYRALKKNQNIFLRTKVHPVVEFLEKEGIAFTTYDYLYDSLNEYDQVYEQIANDLITKAMTDKEIIYAVPGHPMVAEKSVKNLLKLGKENDIEVEIEGGESFIDTFFSRLHIDPIDGFLFLNAEEITRSDLNPSKNTIIGQMYNQFVASEVKLTLMELYPDETVVCLVSNLGMGDNEQIKEIPLYELDHQSSNFNHLTSLFIPKAKEEEVYEKEFFRLKDIVQALRSPTGCPWDRAQTHQSLRKNLIEETYELVETIDDLDMNHMIEELGDVLLQVMLHSQIASEDGYFDAHDVIQQLNKKLIRRHPHVFGDKNAEQAEEALKHWNKIKAQEKEEKGIENESALDGIPRDLPEILKAYKLQKKAATLKFDWNHITDVYDKVNEEIQELKEAEEEEKESELGDLLFAVINLSRFLGIDPEAALARTNNKFKKRFKHIEKRLSENNRSFDEATLEEMEFFWQEAKNLK